ncbi:MAG: hypothetical protein ABIH22_04605, partial [Candidatus Margulisiibacteriota bacterium]
MQSIRFDPKLKTDCADGKVRTIFSLVAMMAKGTRPLFVRVAHNQQNMFLDRAPDQNGFLNILLDCGITDRQIRGKIFSELINVYEKGDFQSNSCFLLDQMYEKVKDGGVEINEAEIERNILTLSPP